MSTPRNDKPPSPCAQQPLSSDSILISEFANDAEMTELIEYFLTELQGGIDSLRSASQQGDHATLRKLAHQLKGAAGGYGYPSITDSAAELEDALRQELLDPGCITSRLEGLIDLCRRAIGASNAQA